MQLIDLTGQRFHRFIVVKRMPPVNKRTMWLCKCDCGNEFIADSQNIRSGHTTSCGCFQRYATSKANLTHGKSKTRLYRIWQCMKNRCYRKSYHAFKHYGGRGISICCEWEHDFYAFYNWAISHGYSDDLSIDRIDANGNYCPENCRWVAMAEQNKNKRVKNGYKLKEA